MRRRNAKLALTGCGCAPQTCVRASECIFQAFNFTLWLPNSVLLPQLVLMMLLLPPLPPTFSARILQSPAIATHKEKSSSSLSLSLCCLLAPLCFVLLATPQLLCDAATECCSKVLYTKNCLKILKKKSNPNSSYCLLFYFLILSYLFPFKYYCILLKVMASSPS